MGRQPAASRQLITRGSDAAFKEAVFRALDWEPVLFRGYTFKRPAGWRDGGVGSIVEPEKRNRFVECSNPVCETRVRIWFRTESYQIVERYYFLSEWYLLCSRGHIRPTSRRQ
jgi:hypothetical protein